EPRVLIADEPAAGLDPAHQLALFRHFVTFATSGRTVLVALHDLSLAARFCHKIVLVHAGRALASGPPEEVLTPPQLAAAYGIAAEYRTIDGLPVVLPFDVLPGYLAGRVLGGSSIGLAVATAAAHQSGARRWRGARCLHLGRT